MGTEGEDGVSLTLESKMRISSLYLLSSFCSVYALLRHELWGEAIEKFQRISYVHSRMTSAPAKAKI